MATALAIIGAVGGLIWLIVHLNLQVWTIAIIAVVGLIVIAIILAANR